MEKTGPELRTSGRRRCRGEVLIYKLLGGEPLKGSLADVGSGGIRVSLDGSLTEGEPVRLVFPREGGTPGRAGRTIIGHVAHRAGGRGFRDVGIAFGWQAAVRGLGDRGPAPRAADAMAAIAPVRRSWAIMRPQGRRDGPSIPVGLAAMNRGSTHPTSIPTPDFQRLLISGTSIPSAVARSIWCSCSWMRIWRICSARANSPSASH